mmetsp:Transcript_12022/g.31567  ORF Transcript_12022/g.31567 Transcript_12022/m.31567 type:complete len:424 (+) Transcript_12022:1-1272(+)
MAVTTWRRTWRTDRGWEDAVAAVGTLIYSFCPMFLAVEVASSMRDPSMVRHALIVAFAFSLFTTMTTGVVVDLHWGGSVKDPVTDAMAWGSPSVVCNLVLLLCSFTDFAIVGSLVNREVQRSFFPAYDRTYSIANLPTWLYITLPAIGVTLVFVFCVPYLEALKGLVTCFAVPCSMLFGPAGLLLLRFSRKRAELDAPDTKLDAVLRAAHADRPSTRALIVVGIAVGLGLTGAFFAQTISDLGHGTPTDPLSTRSWRVFGKPMWHSDRFHPSWRIKIPHGWRFGDNHSLVAPNGTEYYPDWLRDEGAAAGAMGDLSRFEKMLRRREFFSTHRGDPTNVTVPFARREERMHEAARGVNARGVAVSADDRQQERGADTHAEESHAESHAESKAGASLESLRSASAAVPAAGGGAPYPQSHQYMLR